jgi:hypothetical protein
MRVGSLGDTATTKKDTHTMNTESSEHNENPIVVRVTRYGDYELSYIGNDGEYYHKQYIGYDRCEALAEFDEYLTELGV